MPKGHPWPPLWTAKQDALLGTASDIEVAKKLGKSRQAVHQRRVRLAIPRVCYAPPKSDMSHLTRRGLVELGMLGRFSDAHVAKVTARPLAQVKAKRRELR